jgi:hypothetical protein
MVEKRELDKTFFTLCFRKAKSIAGELPEDKNKFLIYNKR